MGEQTRAYLRERRSLSGKVAFGRDTIVALIGGGLGLLVPETVTKMHPVAFAVTVAVLAVIVFELSAYIWRFIWVVPKQMHFDALGTIARLEKERDDARSAHRGFTGTMMQTVIGSEGDSAVLLVNLTVSNKGNPSALDGWGLTIRSLAITDARPTVIPQSPQELSATSAAGVVFRLTHADAIYEKVNTPIPTGGVVRGWLYYRLPGISKEVLNANLKQCVITFRNVIGERFFVVYDEAQMRPLGSEPMYIPGSSQQMPTRASKTL